MYKSPAIQLPTLTQLVEISKDLGFQLTEDELAQYQDQMKDAQALYQRVSELPEPLPPVKYPRTPGYRPKADDNPYNAWYWVCDIKGAPSGKLCGKTVAIKDSIAVAGVPMMNGSKLLEGYVPEFDASVVTRVLDAGGTIKGKAACEDLCFSGSSFTSATGPVRNPMDETRSAGGSSCGSAALVAGGIVDMALGGDQGGSVRMPASNCGIVGLKPTHGLVPYTGACSFDATFDHLGPMTKTVTDCALLLEAIAGVDGLDGRQQSFYQVPEYSKMLSDTLHGMKIGVVKEGFEGCDSDVVEIVKVATAQFTKAGATVQDISIPVHKDGIAIWTPQIYEGTYMSAMMGACVNLKGFYPTSMLDHMRRAIKTRPQDLPVNVLLTGLWGEYTRKYYHSRFYSKAQNLVRYLTKAYDDALANVDVLVMPTLPTKAHTLPPSDISIKDYIQQSIGMVQNTAPFDSSGHPALSINAGYSEGLPVGMMIIGKHFDDGTVLKVAKAFETLNDLEKGDASVDIKL